ncbi:unnamed protein product [Calypogeia fissa]
MEPPIMHRQSRSRMEDAERLRKGKFPMEQGEPSRRRTSPRSDDLEAGKNVTNEELKRDLKHLQPPPEDYTSEAESQECILDRNVIASRLLQLKQNAVVIYTADLTPPRDVMHEWVANSFGRKLGLGIEQVKTLSRHTFLVVLENNNAQQKLLADAPYYMQRRMILVTPWDPANNRDTCSQFHAPVWVDLLSVDPVLEVYANQLLGRVREVIYAATATARSQYSNIRGCVRVNFNQKLRKFVVGSLPGVAKFKIDVVYRALPGNCLFCFARDHEMYNCPKRKEDRKHVGPAQYRPKPDLNFGPLKPQMDTEGFIRVQRKRKSSPTTSLGSPPRANDHQRKHYRRSTDFRHVHGAARGMPSTYAQPGSKKSGLPEIVVNIAHTTQAEAIWNTPPGAREEGFHDATDELSKISPSPMKTGFRIKVDSASSESSTGQGPSKVPAEVPGDEGEAPDPPLEVEDLQSTAISKAVSNLNFVQCSA